VILSVIEAVEAFTIFASVALDYFAELIGTTYFWASSIRSLPLLLKLPSPFFVGSTRLLQFVKVLRINVLVLLQGCLLGGIAFGARSCPVP